MIVVTGATGHVGGLLAAELASSGEAIRLVVRDLTRAPQLAGAEVVVAEYGDPDALMEALREGDRVFMVSLHEKPRRRIELHHSFIQIAARQHVRHIVYLSFVNAGPEAAFLQARSHGRTEELLNESGIKWTSIRNSMYADHIPGWFDQDGVLREAGGEGRMSFSYRPELAKAIAVTLTEPGHDNMVYNITTPDTVSMAELAQIASQATQRCYRYEPMSDKEWEARWRARGRSDWEITAGLSSYQALRDGQLAVTSNDYRRLTGLAPLTIGAIVERLTEELPAQ